LPRANGGFARVAMNTASIVSADGEVEGVIAIGRDITEVRQLEEQIIQAEKLATLGQLAAGVVHELNNPLTSISVYSDYLLKKGERGTGEPSDLEKLRRIVQSAERILNFTRDLVAYARPSNEEPRLISIHDVLDQSVVFCEHVIAESGVRVVKKYAENVQPVYAVKGQLHQVFINLITNACHAMPMGAGHLTVETEPVEERLMVRLADNGAGIPSDHLDRIFEPFFSTKGEGKGTGLGLSIVRNIVHQHGGSIQVKSELGGGTAFEIALPYRV
jgi:signal transduction histidine kinase